MFFMLSAVSASSAARMLGETCKREKQALKLHQQSATLNPTSGNCTRFWQKMSYQMGSEGHYIKRRVDCTEAKAPLCAGKDLRAASLSHNLPGSLVKPNYPHNKISRFPWLARFGIISALQIPSGYTTNVPALFYQPRQRSLHLLTRAHTQVDASLTVPWLNSSSQLLSFPGTPRRSGRQLGRTVRGWSGKGGGWRVEGGGQGRDGEIGWIKTHNASRLIGFSTEVRRAVCVQNGNGTTGRNGDLRSRLIQAMQCFNFKVLLTVSGPPQCSLTKHTAHKTRQLKTENYCPDCSEFKPGRLDLRDHLPGETAVWGYWGTSISSSALCQIHFINISTKKLCLQPTWVQTLWLAGQIWPTLSHYAGLESLNIVWILNLTRCMWILIPRKRQPPGPVFFFQIDGDEKKSKNTKYTQKSKMRKVDPEENFRKAQS